MNSAICPSCGEARLVPKVERKTFSPPAGEVVVDLMTNHCENCGARVTTRLQRAQNLVALAARKSAYGEWLTGEDVLALRKKYGITQQQASEIFGKGKIAFSRYENEASYPDLAMTRLMRLALDNAGVMKQLAAVAHIELPLLEKRLSEELLRTVLQFIATGKQIDTGSLDTKTTEAMFGFGSVSRLLTDAVLRIQALTHPSITSTGASAAEISACNDERFALAA